MRTYRGIVLEGSRKASALGFPTANIEITESLTGIYAGTIVVNGREHYAAIFADAKRTLLEAYILDFSGDLYGAEVTLTLLKKIRDHANFTDDDSLKRQIAQDVADTRAYFSALS